MQKLGDVGISDEGAIENLLSSSPYYLKLADSLLANVDRKTLAYVVASYLYFKSKGKADSEFLRFVLIKKSPQLLQIALEVAPVILPAIFLDKRFRSLIVDITIKALQAKKKA